MSVIHAHAHHEVYVAVVIHEVLHELLKAVLLSTHLWEGGPHIEVSVK